MCVFYFFIFIISFTAFLRSIRRSAVLSNPLFFSPSFAPFLQTDARHRKYAACAPPQFTLRETFCLTKASVAPNRTSETRVMEAPSKGGASAVSLQILSTKKSFSAIEETR